MVEALEARTRAAFPGDETKTHLDLAELWLSSGKTMLALAEDLSGMMEWPEGEERDDKPLGCSAEMIRRHLVSSSGADETETRLSRARITGSHRLSDETLSIADKVKHKDDVPAARLQVSARQWVAQQWNPAEFGQSKGGGVTVNICALHLDALKHANERQRIASHPAPRLLPNGGDGGDSGAAA